MAESIYERTKDLKILLVEDEKFTIDVYKKFVSRYFDHVFAAANGEEGFEVYKEHKPDIVVADIMMPVMDGLEMSGLIKALNPEVQIIVSTAYMDTQMMGRAIEAGVDHYITKPLKRKLFLSVLEKSIDAVLKRKEAQNEIRRLTELLTAIKNIIELVVKSENKETLLEKVCQILVRRNLYSGVWIVLTDKNGQPAWGHSEGVNLESFESMMERMERGDHVYCVQQVGGEGTAYEVVYNKGDKCSGCQMSVCLSDHCAFILKLEYHGKLYGYLNISINEDIIKNKDELELLVDAANDITYALNRFDLEESSKKNEELLLHQSRLAAMGEMISMIAHQWRQPIATIGMSANNMLVDLELRDGKEPVLKNHIVSIVDQVMFLSKTIDDFKNFFRPNKKKRKSSLGDLIGELLKMMEKTLSTENIELIIEEKNDQELFTYDSELVHVLINIVKNAKDELIRKNIQGAFIKLTYAVEENRVVITVEDNAGGIPQGHLLKIFEPYFSTKGENGTGLGLYMSEIIITKHFHGSISAANTENGALFRIEFPIDDLV